MIRSLTLTVSLIFGYSYSQTLQWIKSEPFKSHFSNYIYTVNDKQGNVFTASYWSQGGIYLVKYDSKGVKLWEKPCPGLSGVQSVCVDNSGCFYVSIGLNTLEI